LLHHLGYQCTYSIYLPRLNATVLLCCVQKAVQDLLKAFENSTQNNNPAVDVNTAANNGTLDDTNADANNDQEATGHDVRQASSFQRQNHNESANNERRNLLRLSRSVSQTRARCGRSEARYPRHWLSAAPLGLAPARRGRDESSQRLYRRSLSSASHQHQQQRSRDRLPRHASLPFAARRRSDLPLNL